MHLFDFFLRLPQLPLKKKKKKRFRLINKHCGFAEKSLKGKKPLWPESNRTFSPNSDATQVLRKITNPQDAVRSLASHRRAPNSCPGIGPDWGRLECAGQRVARGGGRPRSSLPPLRQLIASGAQNLGTWGSRRGPCQEPHLSGPHIGSAPERYWLRSSPLRLYECPSAPWPGRRPPGHTERGRPRRRCHHRRRPHQEPAAAGRRCSAWTWSWGDGHPAGERPGLLTDDQW